jgi:hypothetical protein
VAQGGYECRMFVNKMEFIDYLGNYLLHKKYLAVLSVASRFIFQKYQCPTNSQLTKPMEQSLC